MNDLTRRLARISASHPGRTLGLWGVAVVASVFVIAVLLGSALTTEGEMTNDPESYRGYALIREHFPPNPEDMVNEVVIVRSATVSTGAPAFKRHVTTLAAHLEDTGLVLATRTFYGTGERALTSPDGHAALITVALAPSGEDRIGEIVDTVDAAETEGFETAVTGEFTADEDYQRLSEEDLQKGEFQFGIPAALVVLLLVFGSIVAGLVPVLTALVAIVVALALTTLVGQAFDLSVFVVNMLTGMGLALGIDYALFIVSRYREERNRGRPELDAITVSGATASRAVLRTTMQMTHLADMPGVPGPDEKSHAFLYSQIRSSAVAKQFKALGYRYINIGSWWTPTRSSPLADENLHTPGPDEFASSLIEASALPAILRRAGVVVDARERHWENNQFGLDAALGVRDDPGPKFVFAHILLPHPPYVHEVDGSFRTTAALAGVPIETRFSDQLAYANSRIREIVDGLLALPEPQRPIVILQADEGPRTPKYSATGSTTWDWDSTTTEQLEIKFGILNAWYVPGDRPIGLYDGQTSVNTFPLLFRDYFGLDYDLLPDRVFAARKYDLPYDQLEITDRLPAPAP